MEPMTAIAELEKAVSNGAQRLDLHAPGWRDNIDADRIEAGCEVHSVTGQLFGPMLADQIRGVGLSLDTEKPWESVKTFTTYGYAVMSNEAVPIPAEVIEALKSAARTMAAAMGIPGEPRFDELPEVLPSPRDSDVVAMEIDTLTYLWEREVAKRNR